MYFLYFGIALIIIELLLSFSVMYLFFIGTSLIIGYVFNVIFNVSIEYSLLISSLSMILISFLFNKYKYKLNSKEVFNSDLDIGNFVKLDSKISDNNYKVKYKDSYWIAILESDEKDINDESHFIITSKSNNVLHIKIFEK